MADVNRITENHRKRIQHRVVSSAKGALKVDDFDDGHPATRLLAR